MYTNIAGVSLVYIGVHIGNIGVHIGNIGGTTLDYVHQHNRHALCCLNISEWGENHALS